jgi:tripartite-type tricarboxylate transporter receptor subunit TctC
MNKLTVRLIGTLLSGATLMGAAAGVAHAQDKWPSRAIRWVVPFPPGGTTDTTARRIAEPLSKTLGESVTIDNRAGAGGMVGTELVANSPPDGYTWIYGTSGTMAANLALYSNVRYSPSKDFVPVHGLFESPLVLVVPTSRPYKTVPELIAYVKANQGKANFGSAGAGTATHLTGELFKTAAGIDMLHVPYKGSAPSLNDLMAGRLDMMFDYGQVVAPLVAGGKLRAIAVTSSKRVPLFKDVPTVAESGLPGFESSAWASIMMPAKTPPAIVKKVSDEVGKLLADEQFVKPWVDNGSIPLVGKSEEKLGEFIRSETEKWAEVVKKSGAKIN